MSTQRAATRGAKNREAWRDERKSGWSIGRPDLDADEETLIAVRSPKGITPALTSLRKERLICAANENSDTRLPAITTGKRTVRSPRLGADAAWTRIRD